MAGKDKASWSFTGAMLDFFGKKPGDTAMGFQAELKALDPTDRAYFRAELTKVGYEVTPPAA